MYQITVRIYFDKLSYQDEVKILDGLDRNDVIFKSFRLLEQEFKSFEYMKTLNIERV